MQAVAQTGSQQVELRTYDIPDIPADGALLKVEAAGVCGADVGMLRANVGHDRILGHENVGVIDRIGDIARARWGLNVGDRVALEEYLPCFYCEWCHMGEYRHCWATDILNNPGAPRYGSTQFSLEPGFWGGYSEYLFMPWNAVWHRVPENVPSDVATLHIALSNGVQWCVVEGGVGPGSTVLIQGPGQMGAASVIAAKSAGAALIAVTGLGSDGDRLEVCQALGADVAIDVEAQDVREEVAKITHGKGVDAAIDCTNAGGLGPLLVGVDVLRTRGGTVVTQGGIDNADGFPMRKLANKYITLKQCRGHSYAAVERGLQIMAAGTLPVARMHTHNFPLKETFTAISATAGQLVDGRRALHVAVLPNGE